MSDLILSIASLCFIGMGQPGQVAVEVNKAQLACQQYYLTCMKKKPAKEVDQSWLIGCVIEKDKT